MKVNVRIPCDNTYELTPIKVTKMASTKIWIDKDRSYKARILKRESQIGDLLPRTECLGSLDLNPYRKNIIRNTIEIPIMVMEPSYRTKCRHLQGFKLAVSQSGQGPKNMNMVVAYDWYQRRAEFLRYHFQLLEIMDGSRVWSK